MKHYYYVGVIEEGRVRLVTKICNDTKVALWNKEDKPLSFARSVASDIAEGLCMNLVIAFVIDSFLELNCQPEKMDSKLRRSKTK